MLLNDILQLVVLLDNYTTHVFNNELRYTAHITLYDLDLTVQFQPKSNDKK